MHVSALQGHQRWAPRYDSECNPLLALESRIVRHLLLPIRLKCFLDVACGTGRWMTYLAQRGARVFGVDACAEMLAEAERKPLARSRSIIGDAMRLPFATGIADTVLCSFAAGYFTDLKSALREMARAAKPGGKVIISDLHPGGVASGWSRSFRVGADLYEMQHFGPSVEELRSAGQDAGLQLHMQIDAWFGESERAHFRAMGKEKLYLQLVRTPAVWIGIWIKPS
jgi:ubiquinone/menaquinone biosynthesis C-methylase UbiE